MLDMGTLYVELVVDLPGCRFYVHGDHDFRLLRILSKKRQLLWHGEIRSYGGSQKRDWRTQRADYAAQKNRRMK